MLAEIGQNLALLATKTSCPCTDSYTHACTGQHTRLGRPGDLEQRFLLPFANVITAAQPFLSAWTTENVRGLIFLRLLAAVAAVPGLSLYLLGGGAGCLLRSTLRLAAQRCIYVCIDIPVGTVTNVSQKWCYLSNESTRDTAQIMGSVLDRLGRHNPSEALSFFLWCSFSCLLIMTFNLSNVSS